LELTPRLDPTAIENLAVIQSNQIRHASCLSSGAVARFDRSALESPLGNAWGGSRRFLKTAQLLLKWKYGFPVSARFYVKPLRPSSERLFLLLPKDPKSRGSFPENLKAQEWPQNSALAIQNHSFQNSTNWILKSSQAFSHFAVTQLLTRPETTLSPSGLSVAMECPRDQLKEGEPPLSWGRLVFCQRAAGSLPVRKSEI
jgi:hypothetical protein